MSFEGQNKWLIHLYLTTTFEVGDLEKISRFNFKIAHTMTNISKENSKIVDLLI